MEFRGEAVVSTRRFSIYTWGIRFSINTHSPHFLSFSLSSQTRKKEIFCRFRDQRWTSLTPSSAFSVIHFLNLSLSLSLFHFLPPWEISETISYLSFLYFYRKCNCSVSVLGSFVRISLSISPFFTLLSRESAFDSLSFFA